MEMNAAGRPMSPYEEPIGRLGPTIVEKPYNVNDDVDSFKKHIDEKNLDPIVELIAVYMRELRDQLDNQLNDPEGKSVLKQMVDPRYVRPDYGCNSTKVDEQLNFIPSDKETPEYKTSFRAACNVRPATTYAAAKRAFFHARTQHGKHARKISSI
ncbi:hypothetical protein LSTR_LSTR001058 [Laodelphax striatellus]|uniref:Uncharacterized protein n=1 Tax=Laodelphax striatellus TaxID=195883 RepID=A0A482X111_LAOST|nr:hypothetical protein LSTR_LSTR001058 [Laodelphax striatellus]